MVAARHSLGRALSQAQASLYICRSCRHRLSRTGISIQQQTFATRTALPTTENVTTTIAQNDESSSIESRYDTSRFSKRRDVQSPASRSIAVSQSAQDEYVPAETWEGLEYVGASGDWRDVPPQPEDDFQPWLTPTSMTASNRKQLVSCLHQALVECLTYSQAGLDANVSLRLGRARLDDNVVDTLASATIDLSSTGQPTQVHFGTGSTAEEIVAALEDTAEPSDMNAESDLEELQSGAMFYTVEDESFLTSHLGVEDPLTFIVLKRFTQLSGHRIPDPVLTDLLASNQPLGVFIDRLYDTAVRPKPKKLAEVLMSNPVLAAQSNVMIFPRRETSVDKEKELGRWKVIEKELRNRGLPTLGPLKHL